MDQQNQPPRFYVACEEGRLEEVKAQLAREGTAEELNLNWNNWDWFGAFPFSITCARGHHDVAWAMLQDPRVNPITQTTFGTTGLWVACNNGHIEVVKRLLASGRDIGISLVCTLDGYTPLQRALQSMHYDIARLITNHISDPVASMTRLRRELGLHAEDSSADLFALIVMVENELFSAEADPAANHPAEGAEDTTIRNPKKQNKVSL